MVRRTQVNELSIAYERGLPKVTLPVFLDRFKPSSPIDLGRDPVGRLA